MPRRFLQYLLKNQVIFALFLILFGWFIFQIRGIVVSIFVAYIISAALLPFVRFLVRKKFPRIVATMVAYVSVLCLILLLIVPLVPFVVAQIQSLVVGFPVYLDQSASTLGFEVNSRQVQGYLSSEFANIGTNVITLTGQVFGGIFSVLTIFIISFYLLLDHEALRTWIADLFEKHDRERVLKTLREVDDKLGAWLRGQLFLCIAIGLASWVLLTLLRVPDAIPLALVAALLEAVPTIGPILSAIPSVIVALTISPTLAIAVIIGYIFIQLLENNVLVPKIMQRAVGLNPIIVILAITIGTEVLGMAGALLSIPFVSFLIVLFNSINKNEKE
jgi:predicted PurR-regulated permease PerM